MPLVNVKLEAVSDALGATAERAGSMPFAYIHVLWLAAHRWLARSDERSREMPRDR